MRHRGPITVPLTVTRGSRPLKPLNPNYLGVVAIQITYRHASDADFVQLVAAPYEKRRVAEIDSRKGTPTSRSSNRPATALRQSVAYARLRQHVLRCRRVRLDLLADVGEVNTQVVGFALGGWAPDFA